MKQLEYFKRPPGHEKAITIYGAYSPFRVKLTSLWRKLRYGL